QRCRTPVSFPQAFSNSPCAPPRTRIGELLQPSLVQLWLSVIQAILVRLFCGLILFVVRSRRTTPSPAQLFKGQFHKPFGAEMRVAETRAVNRAESPKPTNAWAPLAGGSGYGLLRRIPTPFA